MKLKKPYKKKIKRKKLKGDYKLFVRKYTSRVKIILKTVIFIGIIVVLIHFLFFSSFFLIKNVAVYGTDRFVNSADVLQMSNSNMMEKNILLLSQKEITKKLHDNFLGAKEVEIQKKLPRTIEVHIKEREPIAIIYQNEEEKFLVDIDGYVLGYTAPENSDLPQIHYKKDISVGLFIDKNLVPVYMELNDLLNSEKIEVSSMSFHPKHISFSLNRGEEVLVGIEKNKLEVVKAISALLKEAELESKTIKRIDLRYDKVIVLFN